MIKDVMTFLPKPKRKAATCTTAAASTTRSTTASEANFTGAAEIAVSRLTAWPAGRHDRVPFHAADFCTSLLIVY
jgi:hypothetical protein